MGFADLHADLIARLVGAVSENRGDERVEAAGLVAPCLDAVHGSPGGMPAGRV